MVYATLFLKGARVRRDERKDIDVIDLSSEGNSIAIVVRVEDVEAAEQLAAELTNAVTRLRPMKSESVGSSEPAALPNVAAPYDAKVVAALQTAPAPGLTSREVVKAMFPHAADIQLQRLIPQISGVLTRMAREGRVEAKHHRYMLAGTGSAPAMAARTL